eukprot:4394321-Prymnesium_polylepis.1
MAIRPPPHRTRCGADPPRAAGSGKGGGGTGRRDWRRVMGGEMSLQQRSRSAECPGFVMLILQFEILQ